VILFVAATEAELCGHPGLVCGVGPVEAAAATARELAREAPTAVLHVGVAGATGLAAGTLVVGTESVYADIAAAIPVISRVEPDPDLVARAKEALPEAVALPIATSAAVRAPCGSEPQGPFVEAMEGFAVLRACELAGVPALEVRAVSNAIGEDDRARWEIRRGLDALESAIPRLLAAFSAGGERA
jgi:futalosine hydrolase